MAFQQRLQPVPRSATLADDDYFVWGGSAVRDEDGQYHLLYSRWPREHGFMAWASHSEIARAVADDPLGPYEHVDVPLDSRNEWFWDGSSAHNPTIERFGNRYYLYYTGNSGDKDVIPGEINWSHRISQRIGVAVADHPGGPWERFDNPLIVPDDDFVDALCCCNPAVTQRPDGDFLILYNSVDNEGDPPFGGPVRHVTAIAADPTGPIQRHRKSVFAVDDVEFPVEDPDVWHDGERYRAILNDIDGHFTDVGRSLVLFESADGFEWSLADDPLVSRTEISWDDGETESLHSLERPQVLVEKGEPQVLYCAAARDHEGHSFNVHIPLAGRH